MNNKPQDPESYLKWLKESRDVEVSSSTQSHYEYVADIIKSEFQESHLWTQLGSNLEEYNNQYFISKSGYSLLGKLSLSLPLLDIKCFDSFLLKTQRINVLDNELWDQSPKNGWVLPDNWYESINDIVRTCIVVNYLDGIEFLGEKIKELCEEDNNRYFTCEFKAKEEGYYAAHIYTRQTCEIPNYLSPGTKEITASVEIQITTHLKDAIYDLLHKHYQKRRTLLIPVPKEVWQWDYKSAEFGINYLGHILHYLDGMIVNVREKE